MGVAGSSRGGGRDRGGGKVGRPSREIPPKPAPKSTSSKPAHSSKSNSTGSNGAADGVVKATIASDYDAGRDVQERILADVKRHGFNANDTFAIRIALEEALVNAIKHGNRHDPGKKIHVEARVSRERAEIIIEDEGPGFNRSGIPDPTLEANLHKCSGRGILLIESYMDGVHWSRGGRRLKMVKENG
jgi:serine/threonine-protein kinase RsbW